MTIDFVSVFSLYVLLFLAVIFIAWILVLWKQLRNRSSSGRRYICGSCGKPVRADHALIVLRCGHCGARNEISKLKSIES
jgi:DNA-directed RNA polymerase subunit RPC12/RpoP